MIGVAILNYHSSDQVMELLETIPTDDYIKIVIVDNSESDQEFSALSRMFSNHQNVSLIQSPKNGGFSFGTNLAIKALISEVEAVLILNPDVKVEKYFFDHLLRLNQLAPGVAVSPSGYHFDGITPWSLGGEFYWLRGRADVTTHDSRFRQITFGTCACLLVPSDVIEKVGFLDEDYFLGGEEWQLSIALKKNGTPIIHAPCCKYYHRVSGTHEKYGAKYFYIGMRTKVLFGRKNYGLLFYMWLFLVASFAPLRAAKYSLKHKTDFLFLLKLAGKAIYKSAKLEKMENTEIVSIKSS